MSWYGFRPYVPVHQKRANAAKQLPRKLGKGKTPQPIEIQGRKIATTFWGSSWCEHLEQFSDYENRLPRGRTYVRNGSVVHLEIKEGEIFACVAGSSLYTTKIAIKTLPAAKWEQLKRQCTGRIASLLELVQGRLSKEVMTVVTHPENGLFPLPGEISFRCSCPDWARMCKHVAAVLYGIGARLDTQPELLFRLRGVEHTELISETSAGEVVGRAAGSTERLDDESLADVFGIELDTDQSSETPATEPQTDTAKKAKKTATRSRKNAAKSEPKAAAPARSRSTKTTKKQTSKTGKTGIGKTAGAKTAAKAAGAKTARKATKKAAKKKTAKKNTSKSNYD